MVQALLKACVRHASSVATRREAGATIAEYALMVGLIALVAFAAVKALGIATNSLFAGFPTSF